MQANTGFQVHSHPLRRRDLRGASHPRRRPLRPTTPEAQTAPGQTVSYDSRESADSAHHPETDPDRRPSFQDQATVEGSQRGTGSVHPERDLRPAPRKTTALTPPENQQKGPASWRAQALCTRRLQDIPEPFSLIIEPKDALAHVGDFAWGRRSFLEDGRADRAADDAKNDGKNDTDHDAADTSGDLNE